MAAGQKVWLAALEKLIWKLNHYHYHYKILHKLTKQKLTHDNT